MNTFKIKTVDGDLAIANVDLIVQQCNCLTVRAHGLSMYLSKTLGANVYGKRREMSHRGNLAIKEDRSKVGTIRIYSRKTHWPHHLACLFSQFAPGKPGMYYQDICKDHDIADNRANRVIWFKQCLEQLKKKIDSLKCKVVAFPYKIGCGLAGGDWSVYEKIITEWAYQHQDNFQVIFVKKD